MSITATTPVAVNGANLRDEDTCGVIATPNLRAGADVPQVEQPRAGANAATISAEVSELMERISQRAATGEISRSQIESMSRIAGVLVDGSGEVTAADLRSLIAPITELEQQVEQRDEEYERGWVDGAAKSTDALTRGDAPDRLAILAAAFTTKLTETSDVGRAQLTGLVAQVEELAATVAQVATAEQIVRAAAADAKRVDSPEEPRGRVDWSNSPEQRAYRLGYAAGRQDASARVADPEERLEEALRDFYRSTPRDSRAATEVAATEDPQQPEPLTACPPWCVTHTVGTPGYPADRTTMHEAVRTTVATAFRSSPVEQLVQRREVEVWAERFDLDENVDGHPVVGFPAVHLSVDGYDSTGMTADQAEEIAEALQQAARAARSRGSGLGRRYDALFDKAMAEATSAQDLGCRIAALSGVMGATPEEREDIETVGQVFWQYTRAGRRSEAGDHTPSSALAVWPPKACPPWCEYADDPAGHADHADLLPDDRYHAWSSGSEEADSTYLSLEGADVANPDVLGADRKVVPQRLVVDMRQPYREVEPTVYLGHYDRGWERDARGLKRDSNGYVVKDPYEVKLTPAEARQLGERLVHLADLADQNNRHHSPESA